VPGSTLGQYGRPAFAEFNSIYAISAGFDALIDWFVDGRAA